MYNRYVPQADGSYRRSRVGDPPPPPCPPLAPPCDPPKANNPPPCPPSKPQPCKQNSGDFLSRLLPKNLDTGDLIVILLLLLMAGDHPEDQNIALLTLAVYLFM